MDSAQVAHQLRIDEGERLRVYKDTKGHLTVGVGHKVLPEDALHLGDTISGSRCLLLLWADIAHAVEICQALWPDFDTYPEEVQEILCNMAFNLGKGGLAKFHDLLRCVKNCAWSAAASAMRDSVWYGQVGARAQRLARRMENVNNG